MPFQINGSSPAAGYEPRMPVGGQSYARLVLPEPTGLNGEGAPVGAAGLPYYELYFDVLSAAGFNWYRTFTGAATSVALTSLQVWNPYTGDYTTYSTSARMHRPVAERPVWGGAAYEGVYILFTGLS